jgi:outer membrane protein assembly factor BamB
VPPQNPWGPPPVPGAAAPRRKKRFLPILLAVLLLVGGGTTFTVYQFASGAWGGAGSGLSVAWTLKSTGGAKVTGGGAADATSWAWLVGDTVVRAQNDGVVAFKLVDGKQAWAVPVPDGTSMCTASRELDNDRVMIVYGAEKCDKMAVVEVRTGKLEREFPAPAYDDSGRIRRIPVVAFGAGSAVISTDRLMHVVKVSDGSKVMGMVPTPGCYFTSGVGIVGDHAVTVENCFGSGDTLVTRFQLTSKGVVWESILKGVDSYGLISADPPVVLTSQGKAAWNLTVLNNEDGKTRQQIPTTIDGVKLDTFPRSPLHPPNAYGMQVHQGILYAEADVSSDTGELFAIDLATGQKRWASTDHEHSVDLIRVDDQGVLAMELGYDKARLVRLDRGSGAVTAVAAGEIPHDSLPVHAILLESERTVVTIPRNTSSVSDPIALSALRY